MGRVRPSACHETAVTNGMATGHAVFLHQFDGVEHDIKDLKHEHQRPKALNVQNPALTLIFPCDFWA